jgi:hypothetical protein
MSVRALDSWDHLDPHELRLMHPFEVVVILRNNRAVRWASVLPEFLELPALARYRSPLVGSTVAADTRVTRQPGGTYHRVVHIEERLQHLVIDRSVVRHPTVASYPEVPRRELRKVSRLQNRAPAHRLNSIGTIDVSSWFTG